MFFELASSIVIILPLGLLTFVFKTTNMIYLHLFLTYLKIGLFGFGGGYAMLSLIQSEVVEKHSWLTSQEFTDIVAISQMTPGPIGINSATYIGYIVTGNVWGSVVATFAVCLPSFILVLLVARAYTKFRENRYVAGAFSVLRPAVVGLIASATLLLINKENFIDYKSIIIFVVVFILTKFFKIHPILVIVLAGISGLFLY
jgi:chromate transporter